MWGGTEAPPFLCILLLPPWHLGEALISLPLHYVWKSSSNCMFLLLLPNHLNRSFSFKTSQSGPLCLSSCPPLPHINHRALCPSGCIIAFTQDTLPLPYQKSA